MNLFKLISPRGTILGTLAVPDAIAAFLYKERHAATYRQPEMKVTFGTPADMSATTSKVDFYRSYQRADAIEFAGCSLEDLEKIPGFYFIPGAAYLKSLMEKE